MIPAIDLAGHSAVDDIRKSEIHKQGVELFLEHGVLVLLNVFQKDFVQQLHDEFMSKYKRYLHDREYEDALRVGDKRTMISMRLEGLFSQSALYANPHIFSMLKFLLGDNLILNGMGCVASLPGSKTQHVHRDHPNIYAYAGRFMEEMRWMSYTPPYAITVGIPLIPLNQNSGGTCFWPGTHLKYMRAQDAAKERGYGFEAELGTVVIFDYRVVHCGTANNSNLIRPLLYYIYSCNWFRDAKNYDRQDPLLVTPAQVQNQPSEYRHLFDWVFDMKTRKSIKADNASSENPDAD